MGLKPRIEGFKGGSAGHTPVEAPNTLRSISYFHIVDLISEGEIPGLVNGLQSVYLDGTPVANADGTLNFTGVSVQFRPGTQDQVYIPGYAGVESDTSVNTELKDAAPWVHAVTDTDLSAVRITLQVDALQQSNTSNGDINGFTVQYAIDIATDGGAYNTVVNTAFAGKTTGPYQRSHRIDLPAATSGWNVRVRRLTPNADSATTSDTTRVVSITEIIDTKLRYPNSALIAISGDASQFTNIPSRAYEIWGRKVRIPSNYDPHTRAYNGVWDGTFQTEWTDNPAWVLFDMITQSRFGLGDVIDDSLVDKWELYDIARYCDELVGDGKGGQEPRFTCNTYLQTSADAFKLLSDLGSIFWGVSYWMGGSIVAAADRPQDPIFTYTDSNAKDFTYQSSPKKTRYTTAQVTWNDPSNAYGQAVEYVEDRLGLTRYGAQLTEFVAFGCTSQGQANRAGRRAIVSSQVETDSATWTCGLDALVGAIPGKYVYVQDPDRAGMRQGGRLSAATTQMVTVDRAPDQVAAGDTLTVHLPTGVAERRTIALVAGRNITVTSPFSQAPVSQSVWAVESATLALQIFRVATVERTDGDDGELRWTVSGTQHVPGKYANIDNGSLIQIPPISKLPTGAQLPPTNVRISSHQVVAQGIANNVMTIEWDAAAGAAEYKVEWQKDSGQWTQAGTVTETSADVQGVYTGTYIARVTAFNNGNTPSIAAVSPATVVNGKTGSPPTLSSLLATPLPFGIALDWTFPPNTEDSQRTEIWSNTTPMRPDADNTTAYKLGDYAYPGNHTEQHGLAGGASLFFWGRIVDKAGNEGPFYPPTGAVNGQTISDPNDPALQAYWAGLIGRSAFTADLLADIDAAGAFGSYVNAPVWATGDAYAEGDIVSHGVHLWRAVHAVAAGGPEPGTDSTTWENIGDVSQTAYGQAAQIHDTTLKVDQIDDQVSSVASQLDALEVTAGTPTKAGADTTPAGANTRLAGIYTYSVARVDGDLAEALKTDTLTAQVSGYSASIQTIQQAQSSLDGKVSAQLVWKVQVAANGQRYMAGIAIGADYSGGDVTSQVTVNAATFSVINATDGSVPTTYPFVIQGGQVFISQALIGTGWITNAMIGNQIASSAVTSSGLPVWEINKNGTRYVRGNQFTITEDVNGWRMTNAAGIVVIEMGAGS